MWKFINPNDRIMHTAGWRPAFEVGLNELASGINL
jgi:hypothetical protein